MRTTVDPPLPAEMPVTPHATATIRQASAIHRLVRRMLAGLFESQVRENENLPLQVERRTLAAREQLHQDVGVLRTGAKHILIGTMVQHKLQGEGSRLAALLLSPGGL